MLLSADPFVGDFAVRPIRLVPLYAAIASGALLAAPAAAQVDPAAYTAEECPFCGEWNEPRGALRLFGNSYWVGTGGLGAILVTSPTGHVLIDGGLPQSASRILDNIRGLGFDPEDVNALVNTHAHFDHAGGMAALQEATGATVYALPAAAAALRTGAPTDDDPQRGSALVYPPVQDVVVIADGDSVRAGGVAVVAHLTPGHAPGGTTWSWRSCAEGVCRDMVYADSQTPISDDGFLYSDGDRVAHFEAGLQAIEGLACDILMTPHPGASGLWDRVDAMEAGEVDALVDRGACRRYAERYRVLLEERLARERGG